MRDDEWEGLHGGSIEERQKLYEKGKKKVTAVAAWLRLKWDPAVESLDHFVVRFNSLATEAGYIPEEHKRYFQVCLPKEYWGIIWCCDTIEEAVEKIKTEKGYCSFG